MSNDPAQRRPDAILLIDDDLTVRTVTSRALKAFGYEVLIAADGASGVQVFEANADRLACVLLDMTMPGMNGEQAFAAMKQLRDDVRVVLMSGYAEYDAAERFSGSGLAGFIQKPYELDTLREAIERAVGGVAAP